MKKYFVLSLVAILITFASACDNTCPPNEKIGTIDLSDTTKLFIPASYLAEKVQVFENNSGAEIKLILSEQNQQIDKLCIETICTEPVFDGESTCKYFDASSHRFIYANEQSSILLDLLFSMEIAKPKAVSFYDIMTVGMSTENNLFAYSQFISDVRFEDSSIVPTVSSNVEMQLLPEVVLLDSTFTNVYANEMDLLKTYFTRENGLVGFDLDGQLWRLVSVE